MELDFYRAPELLKTLVDAMAVGVFTVDAQGNFVAWSQGAERITGYAAADVIGHPCHILDGPNCKGLGKISDLLKMDNLIGSICNQECKVLREDGQDLYLYGSLRLITDDQDQVLGAIGTFTDLTSFILANERVNLLEEQIKQRHQFENMVGKSHLMQEVYRKLRLAAQSEVTVLVTGESGTGKELAAAAIHRLSDRKSAPFLAINCSAIPESLIESELFGHREGAFTGAVKNKMGVVEAARGGTLFLDEIGDISQSTQVKLLRALQEKQVRPLGSNQTIPVDVRIIGATNKDLKQLVEQGEIREDFYYRICVFEIELPPLRDRSEDIPLLIDHFLNQHSSPTVKGVARDALQALMNYPWPGNIRQLHNAIEHALVLAGGETINLLDLPLYLRQSESAPAHGNTTSIASPDKVPQTDREKVIAALKKFSGNRTKAATYLGMSRVGLWKKMKRLDIQPREFSTN